MALQELEINLIANPWDEDDAAVALLNTLKAALTALIKAAEKFEDDFTEPPGNRYQALLDAKKALLEEFSIDINLWHAYTQLNFIDVMLEKSKLNLRDRLDGIEDKDIIEWLEEAEAAKHKFQTLLVDSLEKK